MGTPLVIILFTVIISWPLGCYLTWALEPTGIRSRRAVFERFSVKLLGQRIKEEQTWQQYVWALVIFNALMFLVSLAIISLQQYLPLNPDSKTGLEPSLIFHTITSFVTNTNLQHYSGEVSLSYFTQIFALMWLQFVSAATGLSAFAALCRALSGRATVGNFFADLWRVVVLIFLPLSFILACYLCLCGVPMTFEGAVQALTLEGKSQLIARGPVAAFVAIKQLGTNGGGFFGPNSAHPFENPTYWTNILSNFAILIIPMSCVWMFGRITNRLRHAGIIFGVMLFLFFVFAGFAYNFESAPASSLSGLPVTTQGNLEGKELRFGSFAGSLWAVSTTATSNGSVNAMHDSLNPLTGLIPMLGMWLNVIFGGVGVGFINMFLFIIVTVFISGMMVGRTPEYLCRKVEVHEMKLAVFALLLHPFLILTGVALFVVTPFGLSTIQETGSHGFSEILYEFSSASANNGSGFEGLGDNTIPWNVATGIVMLLARFIPIILPLAIAGSLASKIATPETSGTLRVDTLLFGFVLLSTVLILSALLFMPLAMLGPIAEHLGL
jgi:K+-transporting ATPase ATPase A chain